MAAYRRQPRKAWNLYGRLLRTGWAGKVQQVQAHLQQQLRRLGPPTDDAPDDAPGRVVAKVLAYVTANAQRMNYPRCRREGLPVSSAAVGSLIKQFNQGVKGTEKFWLRGGAEAVLQVRAAYLSDDGCGEAFPPIGPAAAGRGRLRPAARTVVHPGSRCRSMRACRHPKMRYNHRIAWQGLSLRTLRPAY